MTDYGAIQFYFRLVILQVPAFTKGSFFILQCKNSSSNVFLKNTLNLDKLIAIEKQTHRPNELPAQ